MVRSTRPSTRTNISQRSHGPSSSRLLLEPQGGGGGSLLETINEDVEMTSAYANLSPHSPLLPLPRQRTRSRASILATHLFAAAVMMVAASTVSTYWRRNPLPLCARFWVIIGDEDKCFWRPQPAVILAACTAYAGAAIWWYRQHRRWRYRNQTVAVAVLLGVCASLIVGVAYEEILRNALPWSAFAGLVAVAILDNIFGDRKRIRPFMRGGLAREASGSR
ncbi:hypothetical protein DIS24_g6136 [Lasiodiplodia hormozganensis]|uniref:Uncharacterized protein n=1 Tax=Lasiodiplodia hormozganensis TaxID=869390 RepID=A0AA39YIQ7_9PEZI|nr:hypothetical protein DIS24_g6136 [Lasiodiplodia hormozganensis]